MLTRRCHIALGAAVYLVLFSTSCHGQPPPTLLALAVLVPEPDEVTRAKFRDVHPEQVAALQFGGLSMFYGFFDDLLPDLGLTDPALIRQIIGALREADVYVPTRGRVFFAEPESLLWVVFKSHNGVTRPQIKLYFNPWSPQDCFGAKFYAAMQHLERYRASLVQRYVAEAAPQVTSLLIRSGKNTHHATEPREMARLLDALEHVNEQSYSLTPCEGAPYFSVTLQRQGGKETELDFRPYWPSGADPNLNPPLPLALWNLDCIHKLSPKN